MSAALDRALEAYSVARRARRAAENAGRSDQRLTDAHRDAAVDVANELELDVVRAKVHVCHCGHDPCWCCL